MGYNTLPNRVLLLNADYSPLTVEPLDKAIALVYKGKVDIVTSVDGITLRSQSFTLECPSVIRLKRYQRVPRRQATWRAAAVKKRDNYTCIFCGTKLSAADATIDHIVPRSRLKREGKVYNTWTNTACACRKCQTRKGDKTPEEAGMKLLWVPAIPRTNYIVITSDERPDWKVYLEM